MNEMPKERRHKCVEASDGESPPRLQKEQNHTFMHSVSEGFGINFEVTQITWPVNPIRDYAQ